MSPNTIIIIDGQKLKDIFNNRFIGMYVISVKFNNE